ncbi:hypothetical protein BGZ65_004023 [Modicella reniformis]|uniref:WD40 repeat-like protein n=1 Tax=Modicella reniformis TaxID=1440133 RepID=A0A9P6IZE8_9FUNG|nr:hypothetical protein BGZ65_004023 [Modicella reniformis]
MVRYNGPLAESMMKLNAYMDINASRAKRQWRSLKKVQEYKKRFDIEMKELGKELFMQRMSRSPHIGQSEVIDSAGPGYFRNLSRGLDPIPVPPSLKPVSSSHQRKSESSSSGLMTIRVPPTDHDSSHGFPHPRASGYMRVFEKSTYHLPIAAHHNLAILSLENKNVFEGVFRERRPSSMEINPFSHQTQFEGIAASSSLDGSIHFWNIDSQRLLLRVPAQESGVIPCAETLTWVSEDTIVAVSHLKAGAEWPDPRKTGATERTDKSLPEAQTYLITIYFNTEDQLSVRFHKLPAMPHKKAINCVTAVMREDHSMSYITGAKDKRLILWKFRPRGSQSSKVYQSQGLSELHQMHSKSIAAIMYSHTSKILYTGGDDGKYISYDLEHQKLIKERQFEAAVIHIVQNPADPRINVATQQSRAQQYALMDERTPDETVLTVGYRTPNKISKLPIPSWQPGGGLLSTGVNSDGIIHLWDIRWNSIKFEYGRRPGAGVVTEDVQFNSVAVPGRVGVQSHPIFRNAPPQLEFPSRETIGAPSQILDVGGKTVIQACFHPTRNVMMLMNTDSNLTFMNYGLRSAPA